MQINYKHISFTETMLESEKNKFIESIEKHRRMFHSFNESSMNFSQTSGKSHKKKPITNDELIASFKQCYQTETDIIQLLDNAQKYIPNQFEEWMLIHYIIFCFSQDHKNNFNLFQQAEKKLNNLSKQYFEQPKEIDSLKNSAKRALYIRFIEESINVSKSIISLQEKYNQLKNQLSVNVRKIELIHIINQFHKLIKLQILTHKLDTKNPKILLDCITNFLAAHTYIHANVVNEHHYFSPHDIIEVSATYQKTIQLINQQTIQPDSIYQNDPEVELNELYNLTKKCFLTIENDTDLSFRNDFYVKLYAQIYYCILAYKNQMISHVVLSIIKNESNDEFKKIGLKIAAIVYSDHNLDKPVINKSDLFPKFEAYQRIIEQFFVKETNHNQFEIIPNLTTKQISTAFSMISDDLHKNQIITLFINASITSLSFISEYKRCFKASLEKDFQLLFIENNELCKRNPTNPQAYENLLALLNRYDRQLENKLLAREKPFNSIKENGIEKAVTLFADVDFYIPIILNHLVNFCLATKNFLDIDLPLVILKNIYQNDNDFISYVKKRHPELTNSQLLNKTEFLIQKMIYNSETIPNELKFMKKNIEKAKRFTFTIIDIIDKLIKDHTALEILQNVIDLNDSENFIVNKRSLFFLGILKAICLFNRGETNTLNHFWTNEFSKLITADTNIDISIKKAQTFLKNYSDMYDEAFMVNLKQACLTLKNTDSRFRIILQTLFPAKNDIEENTHYIINEINKTNINSNLIIFINYFIAFAHENRDTLTISNQNALRVLFLVMNDRRLNHETLCQLDSAIIYMSTNKLVNVPTEDIQYYRETRRAFPKLSPVEINEKMIEIKTTFFHRENPMFPNDLVIPDEMQTYKNMNNLEKKHYLLSYYISKTKNFMSLFGKEQIQDYLLQIIETNEFDSNQILPELIKWLKSNYQSIPIIVWEKINNENSNYRHFPDDIINYYDKKLKAYSHYFNPHLVKTIISDLIHQNISAIKIEKELQKIVLTQTLAEIYPLTIFFILRKNFCSDFFNYLFTESNKTNLEIHLRNFIFKATATAEKFTQHDISQIISEKNIWANYVINPTNNTLRFKTNALHLIKEDPKITLFEKEQLIELLTTKQQLKFPEHFIKALKRSSDNQPEIYIELIEIFELFNELLMQPQYENESKVKTDEEYHAQTAVIQAFEDSINNPDNLDNSYITKPNESNFSLYFEKPLIDFIAKIYINEKPHYDEKFDTETIKFVDEYLDMIDWIKTENKPEALLDHFKQLSQAFFRVHLEHIYQFLENSEKRLTHSNLSMD